MISLVRVTLDLVAAARNDAHTLLPLQARRFLLYNVHFPFGTQPGGAQGSGTGPIPKARAPSVLLTKLRCVSTVHSAKGVHVVKR
jgi:hypothetical protein